jgi:hypothetical protein
MDEFNDLIPDNTIVIFTNEEKYLTQEQTKALIRRPSKKRDWFTPHFYRCLPLSIANLYGFEVLAPISFNAIWDGTDNNDAITFTFFESNESLHKNHPLVRSHFGHGILTFEPPWQFRTPKGINLITLNPPNHIINNITVMTGVIETDNLARDFTFNLKIQEPNRIVHIEKGQPIVNLLPIPRYFQDNFQLKFAEDILTEEEIMSELQHWEDSYIARQEQYKNNKPGMHYMSGLNIYEEPFDDHQGPTINYEA